MSSHILAQCVDVSFRHFHSSTTLFENINLCISKGDHLLIRGNSGCGKSTLLAILSKIIPKFYQGHICGSVNLSFSKSAMVLQNPESQIITPTVFEEIAFALENQGMSEGIIIKKISKVLEECGLSHLRNRPTRVLSGGEAQRLSLACAIAQEAEILFLDEPSAYLDPTCASDFFTMLNSHQKTHTWVIVEHRIDEIRNMITKELHLSPENITQKSNTHCISDYACLYEQSLKPVTLRFSGLTHSYNTDPLFEPLECRAVPGSILCISGNSGSGKTTILKKVAGILPTHKGQIWIDDKDVSLLSTKKLASFIVYVPQNPEHFFISQTVCEEWGATFKNAERIMAVKKLFNLSFINDSLHPSFLSEGEKRRLSLAIAFLDTRPLIILDEPTYGLDRASFDILAQLLILLKKQGKTILMVTHESTLVKLCADIEFRLEKGKWNETRK